MNVVVGIDIGGSTTKIMGFRGEEVIKPLFVKATDAITSVFGAFGKFISINGLKLQNVKQIVITGVGASAIKENIYGIPTAKVQEFLALGLGGLYLSKLQEAIIVSMGTGTAMVRARSQGDFTHYGGTGIGGGTLLGLSSCMFNVRDFGAIMELAKNGDTGNINLTISDITQDEIINLPPYATASNFGKVSELATKNDLALGLVNLVFEAIGMQAVFASRIDKINDIVLTGNLSHSPLTWSVFERLMTIVPEKFYLPESSEFATAYGAALAYTRAYEPIESVEKV